MEYTNLRIPTALWERCKTQAALLKKSATALAVDCVSDCIDEMDKPTPGQPRILKLVQLWKADEPLLQSGKKPTKERSRKPASA